MTEEDEARQPVTNLTLNQLTCARLHKRTPVHTSVHAFFSLSLFFSLNVATRSLVICVTLCICDASLSNTLAGGDPSTWTR